MTPSNLSPLKILLIEVSAEIDAQPGRGTRGAVLPPFPLETLSANLKLHEPEWQVNVLQIYGMTDEQVIPEIGMHSPDVVGMTVFTHTRDRARLLSKLIKQILPKTKVVWGGYHPSIAPRTIESERFTDYFVLGEGEVTSLELLRRINGITDTEFADIRGISYTVDGHVVVTAPRPRIDNLDVLPWADRMLEYMDRAGIFGLMFPDPTAQQRVTECYYSRGCQHNCHFCVSAKQYGTVHGDCPPRVTHKSPYRVVEELQHLLSLGVNTVYWTDLTWNTPDGVAVAEAMARAGIHNNSSPENHPGHVDGSIHSNALCRVPLSESEAEAMAHAGFTRIGMGVESFDPETQAWFGKPEPGVESALTSFQNADKNGIATRCLLMLGSPNDSVESIVALANQLHEWDAPIDEIRAACYTPFDEAPHMHVGPEPRIERWDTDHFVAPTNYASIPELEGARTSFLRSYYGDPRYLERRVKSRLARWPHLRPSYEYFLDFLRRQGLADHRL